MEMVTLEEFLDSYLEGTDDIDLWDFLNQMPCSKEAKDEVYDAASSFCCLELYEYLFNKYKDFLSEEEYNHLKNEYRETFSIPLYSINESAYMEDIPL